MIISAILLILFIQGIVPFSLPVFAAKGLWQHPPQSLPLCELLLYFIIHAPISSYRYPSIHLCVSVCELVSETIIQVAVSMNLICLVVSHPAR